MAELDYDEVISEDDASLTVIQAIRQCREEADDAKIGRLAQNRRNRDAFLGRQDWSHKLPGQSREFLPKVPISVEQMAAFVKRGLTQAGDWFSVDVDSSIEQVIYGAQLANMLQVFLDNLWAPNGQTQNFITVLSDGVKNGLLESLIILKIHGGMVTQRSFAFEKGSLDLAQTGTLTQNEPTLDTTEVEEWRLRIDLVRPEDYYPDPSGNGLYEIHRVERDLHEVLKMAEDGIYDKAAVKQLIDEDYPRPTDEERSAADRNQDDPFSVPKFRKRVVLDEFWGTLLKPDGTIAHRNVVATVANDRFLIRPPEPNPFWHQESPFVAVPLIRVPWSVWHKALYDNASALNLAINEMFNLMLDGGLAAVWGVKQIRLEDLEDPGQVAGGVPQGATLAVKGTLPYNAKVLETVTQGQVPQDSMAIFEFLNREFMQAALTNEIKVGSLPPKQVRATEVIEASQSQAVTLDGIITDLETECIEAVLRKAFLVVLQNADRIPEDVIKSSVSSKTALLIMRASPAERFSLFAGKAKFSVHGLSAMMSRAKDFQKIMAMMQAVGVNPLLFQAFQQKFSADKTLRQMMRSLSINPNDIEMDPEEQAAAAQNQAAIPGIANMLSGGAKGTQGGQSSTGGEPGMSSDINQQANPTTGMAPNQ